MALDKQEILASVVSTGIVQPGHITLDSGLHGDMIVDSEMLLQADTCQPLRLVMGAVGSIAVESEAEGVVPIPDTAVRLAAFGYDQAKHPPILVAQKIGQRTFAIKAPEVRQSIEQARRLLLFEDAVATGATTRAMARLLRQINPGVELDLIGLWRSGPLNQTFLTSFRRATFLIEQELPTHRAKDCTNRSSV